MITQIDMHIRDERLYEWLKERHGQQIPAEKMADIHKCHPNTIYAMVKRLERADLIHVERIYRGGFRYFVKGMQCNENSA